MMAIAPAFHMAGELPEGRRALPVLKVLHRNASRIQEYGGPPREVLHPVQAATLPADRPGGEVLREKVRGANANDAERTFAALASTADDALNNVLFAVQDACEVHRVVLPYRAWDLMGIIGREQAHTLLRQSVRYCVDRGEPNAARRALGSVRTLVPRLLDQHRLLTREPGTRAGDDRWLEELSQTMFRGTPEQAADAAAAALADGYAPAAVAEAICLAANQLILRDNGRPQAEGPNKPAGSIHGDSIGVHACDSANAWRNLRPPGQPAQPGRVPDSGRLASGPRPRQPRRHLSHLATVPARGRPRRGPRSSARPPLARPGRGHSQPRPGRRRRAGRALCRQQSPGPPLVGHVSQLRDQ